MKCVSPIMLFGVILCGLTFLVPKSLAQVSSVQKVYRTSRVNGEAPKIDGIINDPVWDQVEWGESFTQLQPQDGAQPNQPTKFKILYDDKFLYIGYRCFDSAPDSIVSRMSRRDGFEGDWIEVNIDSYNDKRTAFSFTGSVSGVKGDELISEDGNNRDESWNPIWYLKTSKDSLGWVAEKAIPLSQLRFSGEEVQVWGIQFNRRNFRHESKSIWQHIPRNSGYWVSGFGKLEGISGIKPKRQIELQPYLVTKYSTFEKIEGNPFRDGTDLDFTAGLDGKIGITNDLTLDFTINPDFGQVEADPAALNLDGFQVFFSERRPFFLENRNIFDFQVTGSQAGGNYDSDLLFYSRRIGSNPKLFVSGNESQRIFVDQPEITTILGAAKFSGKTKNGLSIGILESLNAREHANVFNNGEESKIVTEPLTNYFIGRIRQDLNEGNTIIGGMITGINRNIDDPGFGFLHDNAYTGGLDLFHQWKEKKWRLGVKWIYSYLSGEEESISRIQRSFEHNFDRPNADHLSVDTAATSLSGQGGTVTLGKFGNRFRMEGGVTWRSPGLDLNDIGFLRTADEINHFFWSGYQFTEPFSIFRYLNLNYNHYSRWDFGGNHLSMRFNTNYYAEFKNFWSVSGGFTVETLDISNNHLRGGPSFRKPNGSFASLSVNSDSRKKVSFGLSGFSGGGTDKLVKFNSLGITIRYQPSNALSFSASPSWNQNFREEQWINEFQYEGETKYLVSQVDQQTLSMTLRLSLNITPDLTIQYYGQPFISRGNYSDYKYVLDPIAKNMDERFVAYPTDQVLIEDGSPQIFIDHAGDGNSVFAFNRPDFSFIQFRSNLVGRWEYKPGSEVYLVWSQGTNSFGNPDDGLLMGLTDNVFSEKIRNTFLIKFTYRLAR